ncbi:SPOSA6832_00845 [Sporobolomyces salmonicolor]|uniref:SPOSA6832_00845-mRNA-1:cds n=1 Tax=Sporidiobolus salmonicolor TaxID=5005 RepID=A0A0D6EHA5_SPOSA|nr:SPOSA6832_00845 [Sporobolomyces salmonicolor]
MSPQYRVDEVIRQRLQLALEAMERGFCADIAKRISLREINVQGVELDGQDDTRPTRSATATVVCELEVDECASIPHSLPLRSMFTSLEAASHRLSDSFSGRANSFVVLCPPYLTSPSLTAMCNIAGNCHGGCIAWIVDHCSSLALLALSGNGRWTTSGLGTPLRIATTVLQFGRVTGLLETRIEDRETGKLLSFGTHTKQDPQLKARL